MAWKIFAKVPNKKVAGQSESHWTVKMLSPPPPPPSSSSDKLVQTCMMLSRQFSQKTAAFYTEQFISPLLFQPRSLMRRFKLVHIELWLQLCRHFFNYACAQSTQQWSVIITQVCWIRNMVRLHRDRELFVWLCQPTLTQCLNRCYRSVILQPILHTLREPVKTNFLLLCKLQLKLAP